MRVTVEARDAIKAAEAGHTVIIGGLMKAGVAHDQEVRLEVLRDDVLEAELAVRPDHIYGERRARLSDEIYSARARLAELEARVEAAGVDVDDLSRAAAHLDRALLLVVPPDYPDDGA